MAKILAKAHRPPVVVTSYKPDDLDYAKYENTNLSRRRSPVRRPASEVRVGSKRESSRERLVKTPNHETLSKRESSRERLVKTPTHETGTRTQQSAVSSKRESSRERRVKTPTHETGTKRESSRETLTKTPSHETGARTQQSALGSKRESSRERLTKTPTHETETRAQQSTVRKDNPVLIKRPESVSSHKYEDSSKKLVQFRKCKTDIKILPDRQRPQTVQGITRKPNTAEKLDKQTSNYHLGREVRSEKGRQISNDIDNLLRVVRNEKIKVESNGDVLKELKGDRTDKFRAPPSPDRPLKEVRKKLQFDNIDHGDEITDKENGCMDFTDKLAAIKTVIDRTRDTRDVLDRRAYYNEYKSSQRKVMVSRNDSLKENSGADVNTNAVSDQDRGQEHSRRDRSVEVKDKSKEHRTRDVRSADIFKSRSVEGRLSVDINKLRNNLEDRRQNGRDSNNDGLNQKPKQQPRRVYANRRSSSSPTTEDDLIHAVSDRKVLSSSVKSKQHDDHTAGKERKIESEHRRVIEDDELIKNGQSSRPRSRSGRRSRLETRETQTELNQSIHSVQSNVPFYDPGRPLTVDTHKDLGRDSVSKTHRKTPSKIQDNVLGDIDLENNVDILSPVRPNYQEDKQTNVADFLGTSVTPEKSKPGPEMLKYSHKQVDKDLEHLRTKLSWLMDDQGQPQIEGDGRPKSRSKVLPTKDHVFKVSTPSKVHLMDVNYNMKPESVEHLLGDGAVLELSPERQSESDKKVRDWIKTQTVLNDGYPKSNQNRHLRTVVVEELSVSVSFKHGLEKVGVANGNNDVKRETDQDDSSNDTCDKYPVKLSKPDSIDTKTSQHRTAYLDGKGQGHLYMSHDHLYGNIKEVPVRDTAVLPTRRVQPESDSTDTESSIVSLPFSVRSGESVSSTIQAVKLMRKLYNVDPDTRQNLVLMARCFRRWLNNVLYAKARNLQITQAASRVSPVTYGVMIRKGEICYRTSILTRYFTMWTEQLREARLKQAVRCLRRKHLLQKGMNAFKWAINRSKLRQGILQDRISGILLASSFTKWKFRASENRRLRMQQAFLRWRQYTKEAQKIRTLRGQTNKNLKVKLFKQWCERYATRVKQHKAEANYRSVLLSHSWLSWKWFTVITKEKKERQTLAIQMYEGTLQRKMFVQMKIEFTKYRKAKDKHRISQLRVAIQAWRLGTQFCKVERENNGRVAEVCWVRTTVRNAFTTWRDALLTRRAVHMSDANITKKAFQLWSERYKYLIQRKEDVDQYVRTKVLSNTFTRWNLFVSVMRRRREAAIECIHAVLQRRVLQTWVWYTHRQRDLRRRLQLYIRKTEMESQRKYLDLWRSKFKVRCDEQRAQQFWSNMCAKKASDHWRMVCHRRKLVRLLQESEPQRQLTVQRVFFMKWLARLQQMEDEKLEASEVRLVLDQSLLRKCFDKWHTASQKLVLVKPMVLRYRHNLVTQCFQRWGHYVKHKAQCFHSHQEVVKLRLKHKFAAWRRQYTVHQIEKEYNKKLITKQAGRCLHAWRRVIQRKHSAKHFYENHLLKSSFYYWNMLAVQQVRQKKLHHMEQESIMSSLREYFDRWRDKMQQQQAASESGTIYLQEVQDTNRLRAMFTFWRRHFRATLIARENEKIRTRKLAKQALQEWHLSTQNSLQDAVHKFAAAIGMEVSRDAALQNVDVNDRYASGDNEMLMDMFEPLNIDQDLGADSIQSPGTPKTPRTPRTPQTPRPGSSYGTPLKRLFSPSQSRQSLVQSMDFDAPLLSSSFLDARFEMEQAVKTESRREIVVTAVTRLRHWPLSNVFDQWKEYTARQLEFKHLTTQMKLIQEKLELSMMFKDWVTRYRNTQLAKQHYDQVIQHKALLSLILYRNSRKHKKELAMVANQHYARTVFTALFPVWLQRTQEKQHTEHILHLWDNITPQEQQLIPRERSFKYKQNRKLLVTCFTSWQTQFRKIDKLKRAYHKILLERYFGSWSKWALQRHSERVKCQAFKNKRIKTLVFRQWCLRHRQKTEVARRYEDTWSNYQGRIFQAWHRWAQDQRKHKLLACQVIQMRNEHLVTQMFTVWKASAERQIEVQKWFNIRLSQRALRGWHEVAVWQKDLRDRMLQCRLMSYKILAKRAFQHWHKSFCRRLENRKLHDQIVEKRILRIATKWRRKAQKTRGEWLKQTLEQRMVKRYLEKWKEGYGRQQDRLTVLEEYLSSKNRGVMSQCLTTWRTELMALQAQRVFNMKLLVTFVENWKLTAKGCKERRQILQTYQTRKQSHSQKVYFLYWFNVAKARKSIRGHANLKMQLSVFKSWLLYTRKQINLRRLEAAFTRKKNEKTTERYWYMIKTRYHYCVELTDMSNRVIHEKNHRLMRMALSHWDFRLKVVIADEFYEHLLARRAAKQWCRFVARRKQERERMAALMNKAVLFHNKKLCTKVYSGWHSEVKVTRHNNHRRVRLGEKYGRLWKHHVDLAYTAKSLRADRLYMMAWKKWHLEFVKRKAEHKIVAFEKKQKLSMIFVSWRNLCRQKSRRSSMIPLPVSPAFTMPSSLRSLNATPTDEVFSPPPPAVPTAKPTQIPLPNSANTRAKGIGSVTNGRTTPTGLTGQSTPTQLGRKFYSTS